jgi:hypothetical protein
MNLGALTYLRGKRTLDKFIAMPLSANMVEREQRGGKLFPCH